MAIQREGLFRLALMFDGFPEKGFGRLHVALCTKHDVNCLAGPIRRVLSR